MELTSTEHIHQLLESGNQEDLGVFLDSLNISEVEEIIDDFPQHGALFIDVMSSNRAMNTFRILDFPKQERIIAQLSVNRISEIINELPPDDRTAFFSELSGPVVKKLIILLPADERKEALALLGYQEDSVGRLMTPDYIAVKKYWTVEQVLRHIRNFGKDSETIDVIYVIDEHKNLVDDIRIREILLANPNAEISTLVDERFIALHANDTQQEAIQVFKMNNRVALPVIDNFGVLLGIVTVDDILWIAQEEYTEDIQKIGGTSALDEPYLDVPIFKLVRKRAGWLIVLFLSEMLTATAMQHYEDQIAKAVVLALFIPLIMSSGGNSGSQASTLIIQAMALGEVTLAEWWRVMRREIISGFLLGAILGTIGFIRIALGQVTGLFNYGAHWGHVAAAIGCSLVGIVLWGSLIGSMMPLIMKRLKLDPATSSAPFVATLVDVTGIVIYFTVASFILNGITI